MGKKQTADPAKNKMRDRIKSGSHSLNPGKFLPTLSCHLQLSLP